ncbi:MAG: Glycerate kinase [uncultured Friedmanniella sp.]|uniref:Glycerate kinase n=1 Tax=uncultured Friedmanniella sp. TaxID=335381 RepID=A0A6J4K1L9_9ACTN|nr:glycerate kinase [uncultured Friedmanniella sp.]CAA9293360.1 MAG: Glycerate kinase [uncultured Friedmanniella sp.]
MTTPGPGGRRVLVAPDKFKGCLTAVEVAAAVGRGLQQEIPDLAVVELPVADGGDGTVEAALTAGYSEVWAPATGPTGEPSTARYARRGQTAVVELAAVVGLDLLPGRRLEPLRSSTYGLGLVLRHAVEAGVQEVVLGLGGSASTDGGAGLAQALGARVLDAAGNELPPGGAALAEVAALDLRELRSRLEGVRVLVASDVTHPLLGTNGAAAVFGPQKGAGPAEVDQLDAALGRWAAVVAVATGTDHAAAAGAGAAGGAGFAALALLGGEMRSGIELVLDLIGFDQHLAGAALVVTGEGSLDVQSLAGKAPVGVLQRARAVGVAVVVVAGRSLLSAAESRAAGFGAVYPLSDLEPDVARSMANAGPLLTQCGATIARDWLA